LVLLGKINEKLTIPCTDVGSIDHCSLPHLDTKLGSTVYLIKYSIVASLYAEITAELCSYGI
jgi:hypothetical protein